MKNDEAHRKRISEGAKAWWQNPDNRAKVTVSHSGSEFGKRVSLGKKGKPGKGSRKCDTDCQCKRHDRQPPSEETLARMRAVQSARAQLPDVQEHLKRITLLASTPEARIRQQAYLQNPEIIEMYRQNMLTRRIPQKLTSIEIKLRDAFIEAEFTFDMHKPFVGKFQPDFTFTEDKLLVEADGIYWHSQPDRIEADKRKEEIAESLGWKVLRFTDKEINSDVLACVEKVQAQLSQS